VKNHAKRGLNYGHNLDSLRKAFSKNTVAAQASIF